MYPVSPTIRFSLHPIRFDLGMLFTEHFRSQQEHHLSSVVKYLCWSDSLVKSTNSHSFFQSNHNCRLCWILHHDSVVLCTVNKIEELGWFVLIKNIQPIIYLLILVYGNPAKFCICKGFLPYIFILYLRLLKMSEKLEMNRFPSSFY